MRLLTTTFLLFAIGCVGTIGDGQNPGDDDGSNGSGSNTNTMGRAKFKAEVHAVIGKCSGGGCHNTDAVSGALSKFYSVDADASYNATVQAPLLVGQFASISPIIAHVEAGHKGITYTADEKAKITGWLAVEAMERAGGNGTPPPPDPKIALREWSGCMSLTNFTTAKMPTAWGGLVVANGQKCVNCHQNGLGILINANADIFFNSMAQQSYFMLKFFTVDNTGKVIMNTGSFTNASTMAGHPTFNPTTNAGMTALKDFYDLTLARKTAGTCDPARLMD